jgi:predicted nuclease with RNAse H fold
MGIDTPLGFSRPFIDLITNFAAIEPIGTSETNPYLYRQTELHLFRKGLRPLSSIKDMIGSQATKGMHVLARFAPLVKSCGLWTDGAGFRAIETYPTACRQDTRVVALRNGRALTHADMDDALTCAIVAYLFANEKDLLEEPADTVPACEGWIWAPR